jgi:HD superfamily phosphohydrolase
LQESAPIRQALDAVAPDLLEQILLVYLKKHPLPLVWQLVSSQLDCDRLDYLMRDSYFTGASYGRIDLDRILMAMRYDPVTQQLVVARKGMTAVEHYLIVRYFMYAQVYNHPKNIAACWVLQQAFVRARELLQQGQLDADETVQAWLSGPCDRLPLHQYLAADDGVFTYHLQRWQVSTDQILADLCRRYIDRDLPKALDVTHLDQAARQTVLQAVHQRLVTTNGNATYYAGLQVSLSRGYTLYQRGIKCQTTKGLQELSELSPLVRTLTNPYERAWLIYPRSIEPTVLALLEMP